MRTGGGELVDLRVIAAAIDFRIFEYTSALRVLIRPSTVRHVVLLVYTIIGLPSSYALGVVGGFLASQHIRSESTQAVLLCGVVVSLTGVGLWLALKEGTNSNRVAITLLANRHLMDAIGVTASHAWVAYRVVPLGAKMSAALLFSVGLISARGSETGTPIVAVMLVVMTALTWLAVSTATSASNFYDHPQRRSTLSRTTRFVGTAALVAIGLSSVLALWSYWAGFTPTMEWVTNLSASAVSMAVVGYIVALFVACGGAVLYLVPRVGELDYARPLKGTPWSRSPGPQGRGILSLATLIVLNELRTLSIFEPLRAYARFWWAVAVGLVLTGSFMNLRSSTLAGLHTIPLPATHALYLVCALTSFFVASEVGNKIGFRAKSARFRYLEELGLPPRKTAAAYFLAVTGVSTYVTLPIAAGFLTVASYLSDFTVTPFSIMTGALGLIVGTYAPAVSESLVLSPMNSDGTKRVDMAESVVGMALAATPSTAFFMPAYSATAVISIFAVVLVTVAIARSISSMKRTPQWIS